MVIECAVCITCPPEPDKEVPAAISTAPLAPIFAVPVAMRIVPLDCPELAPDIIDTDPDASVEDADANKAVPLLPCSPTPVMTTTLPPFMPFPAINFASAPAPEPLLPALM